MAPWIRLLIPAWVGGMLAVASALLAPASAWSAVPAVRLSAWEQSADGTGVVFKPSPATVSEDDTRLTDTVGRFEYGIDTSELRWAVDCRCYRYYVVVVRSSADRVISRHKFRGIPSGRFDDQRVTVRLTIDDGTAPAATEDVTLPVASAPGLEPAPLVTIVKQRELESASLGGSTEVEFVLRNPNPDMEMRVPSPLTLTSENPRLWKQVQALRQVEYPLLLPARSSESIRFRLAPNTWEAIQASLVPSDSTKPHTRVVLKVPYANSLFGQRDGTAEVPLDIRFRPSLVSLATTLVVGVLLGSIITLLRGESLPNALRGGGTALAVALVLELLGIFLVAKGSKFVLFELELDPWQTLPVLLLGIGTGLLGLKSAEKLGFINKPGAP